MKFFIPHPRYTLFFIVCFFIAQKSYANVVTPTPKSQKQISKLCGNGKQDQNEQCDDGNTVTGDGCDALCHIENLRILKCGNGIVNDGEDCDDRNTISGDGCYECKFERRFNGRPQVCGNHIIEGTERCDDGNRVAGDGCSKKCFVEVCEMDLSELPEDYLVRDYPNAQHISHCLSETQIQYAICPTDGSSPTLTNEACPTGSTCENGTCRLVQSCTDPDGQNIHTAATTSAIDQFGQITNRTDRCHSSLDTVVVEAVCNGDQIETNIIECPEDEICQNGICQTFQGQTQTPSCTDPDRQNIHTTTTTSATDQFGQVTTRTDRCHSSLDTVVVEAVCNGDQVETNYIECPEGEICQNGSCQTFQGQPQTPTCTDPDAQNIHTTTTTSGTDQFGQDTTRTDRCHTSSENVVVEAVCNGNQVVADYITCPEGEVCQGGRCAPFNPVETCECQRTPATNQTAGYVTSNTCTVQHDICSGNTLIQFDCNQNQQVIESSRTNCANGCANGLCR